jgi:hypothetical protein
MPNIKSIEEAVRALPPHDLAEFRKWFAEFDQSAWDRQIEADLAGGKLDEFMAEAKADYEVLPRREL